MPKITVRVTNYGIVYSGPNPQQAAATFEEMKRDVESKLMPTSGESVIMAQDDSLLNHHMGRFEYAQKFIKSTELAGK